MISRTTITTVSDPSGSSISLLQMILWREESSIRLMTVREANCNLDSTYGACDRALFCFPRPKCDTAQSILNRQHIYVEMSVEHEITILFLSRSSWLNSQD